jgi:threonine dehydrogenase-like Zn-dependent dehydrogenase
MRKILFTAYEKAELCDVPEPQGNLDPGKIRCRSEVTLVSPGTELNWGFRGKTFPVHTGYTNVSVIEEVGAEVTGLKPGDTVFSHGAHVEKFDYNAKSVVKVPEGLKPEVAVYARLMGISMSTLNTAAAHPPSSVLVTGLGPIGNLAAQIFRRCGYSVTGVEPDALRRQDALACGLKDVRPDAAEACADLKDKVALHIECSGHELAVLQGCRLVRKRGEVVLLGVPWKRLTDVYAHEILHEVFHRFVVLRSGWEWEIPIDLNPRDFSFYSINNNVVCAMDWLMEGSIQTAPLGSTYSPADCQKVYLGLLNKTLPTSTALFDWRPSFAPQKT